MAVIVDPIKAVFRARPEAYVIDECLKACAPFFAHTNPAPVIPREVMWPAFGAAAQPSLIPSLKFRAVRQAVFFGGSAKLSGDVTAQATARLCFAVPELILANADLGAARAAADITLVMARPGGQSQNSELAGRLAGHV